MALYVGNDMVITVAGLTDQAGAAVTSATVEATLFESDAATEVTGITWPVTLSHDGSGTYSGVMDKAAAVTLGAIYWLRVDAVAGSADARWWSQEVATRRLFDE